MKKYETLSKVFQYGLVAVIRGNSKEEAINISKACIDGGIKCIEITFTVPKAEVVIKELASNYKDIVVGAGTVLEECTARLAIMAGAQFVVSPTFSKSTAEMCNLYQIPYMPGCMTIGEMQEALKIGVDIIKLFPGNMYKPEFIKAVKAPLPQVNIMPTGGVNLENLDSWFENGVIAVGVGSNLTSTFNGNDYSSVSVVAKQYVERINAIKSKYVFSK